MSEDDENLSKESRKWNVTVPEPWATELTTLIKSFGYPSISEFFREAGRNQAIYLQEKMSRRILDQLISMGKVTPKDLREALYEISTPRTK